MAENKEVFNQSPETVINKTEGMTDLQERKETEKLPRELETWMERIEKDPTQQVVNDINNQPLLQTATPTKPKIVLPITRQKFIAGFKKKVNETGRWLSTFILKLIKAKDGEVEFKKNE
jgi:hypothetical protein